MILVICFNLIVLFIIQILTGDHYDDVFINKLIIFNGQPFKCESGPERIDNKNMSFREEFHSALA